MSIWSNSGPQDHFFVGGGYGTQSHRASYAQKLGQGLRSAQLTWNLVVLVWAHRARPSCKAIMSSHCAIG